MSFFQKAILSSAYLRMYNKFCAEGKSGLQGIGERDVYDKIKRGQYRWLMIQKDWFMRKD